MLVKALFILLLQYCCQLWNPWKAEDIQAIKAIHWTFTYTITEVHHLNYWDTVNVIHIMIDMWKITQHMLPNIDGTMGVQIKTRKHRYSVSNKQKPSTIPSRKCNNCIWASVVQLVAKISHRHLKVLKWWAKNAQLYHRIRKQQHPRSAHSSESSINLPKWWSPRLCHGAMVLAASKPLQVSKSVSRIWFHCAPNDHFIDQQHQMISSLWMLDHPSWINVTFCPASWLDKFCLHSSYTRSNRSVLNPVIHFNNWDLILHCCGWKWPLQEWWYLWIITL